MKAPAAGHAARGATQATAPGHATTRRVAVVGAGWAGLAAAVALHDRGYAVTVLEAGRTPGGRARRVTHADFDLPLDNGQHILLGAYSDTLALMRRLGCDPDRLLARMPLALASLDGAFRLRAPRLPAPLHAAYALLTARGLDGRARMAALRLMRALQHAQWQLPAADSVADLLARHGQPDSAVRWLWEPLCLAALNTPIAQADAQLFAHVLRDSLAGKRAASDLLLPRVDLSALWPDAAAALCDVRYGVTVRLVEPSADGVRIDGDFYDAAILAVPPANAARLLGAALGDDQVFTDGSMSGNGAAFDYDSKLADGSTLRDGSAAADVSTLANGPALGAGSIVRRAPPMSGADLAARLSSFEYSPIATLNLRLAAPWRLPMPMMMLREDAARGHDGQWLFDRAALAGDTSRGELSIVVSAAAPLADRLAQTDRESVMAPLIEQVREQAARGGLPPLPAMAHAELLVDKRATFLATPGLARPGNATPWPALCLAGDWTDTGYPAALEGAVRSGQRAATLIAGR
ncbi:FAD-dependent oxidoreductase [Bordetella sp. LUAb4]|uniref:hydroxysqualene dehydroxylase n=1 Tax=Bordetella sp. LUAb4 TaxID=2843195 RepID=UPI001E372CFA|nr:FAD-dependent oxidoreductase [Bordetella sp. LUAb4]